MEGLIVLLILIGAYLFLAPLIALLKISSLKHEIAMLKQNIERLSRDRHLNKSLNADPDEIPNEGTSKATTNETVDTPVFASTKAEDFKPAIVKNTSIFKPLQDDAPKPEFKTAQAKPLLKGPSLIDQALAFIKSHWIYIIAGVSLALSGVFLVQYSIENSLLSPQARTGLGLIMGALLVCFGEYIRRKWGDGERSVTAYLPSVFSSAGLITLFSVTLSARHLYDLIGPNLTFIGLLATSALAVFLGWISSALLAVLGIVGAFVTPLILCGDGDATSLTVYYAVITLAGLLIDRFRNWCWFSALVLTLSLGAFTLLSPLWGPAWSILYAATLIILTILVLTWQIEPKGDDMSLFSILQSGGSLRFKDHAPMLLIHAVIAITTGALMLWGIEETLSDHTTPWLFLLTFLTLSITLTIWLKQALSLEGVTLWPILALTLTFAAILIAVDDPYIDLFAQYQDNAISIQPSNLWQSEAIQLIAINVLVSLIFLWRLFSAGQLSRFYALLSMFAPALSFMAIDLIWEPVHYLGTFSWAAIAMGLAVLMAGYVEQCVRRGALLSTIENRLDKFAVSLGLIAIAGLINFALLIFLSDQALTIALAATVLSIMILDYKFDLPLLSKFSILGIMGVSFRLLADPGVFWALETSPIQMLFVYGSTLGLLVYGWVNYLNEDRIPLRITLESAALSLIAIFVMLILYHIFKWLALDLAAIETYIFATTLLTLSSVQAWRLQQGGRMYAVRLVMMIALMIFTALAFWAAWTGCSPLWSGYCYSPNKYGKSEIHGVILLNTNLIMFALPALIAAFIAKRFTHLSPYFRLYYLGISALLSITWLAHENAFIWRGMTPYSIEMPQAELYMYTLEMLIAGAITLYYAFKTGSPLIKKIGLSLVGLTIAKVFFIDASGLEGLMRAVSFLILGLSLAGLAWINRLLNKEHHES